MATDMSMALGTVWRVLREEGIRLFHLLKVQCQKDGDYPHRLDFVKWMMHMITNSSQFLSLILFINEAFSQRRYFQFSQE